MSKKNSLQSSSSKQANSESQYDVFQAVADPTRRHLLKLLTEADKEMSIAAIKEHFPISRTAVNKHLNVLQGAGLVSSRKAGRETLFKAELSPLVELKQWLAFFENYWDDKLAALKNYLEADQQ